MPRGSHIFLTHTDDASDFTTISSRCAIYGDSDDYGGAFLTNPTIPDKYRNVQGGKVTIKKHAILGTGVSVLPGVTVGEGCSVGSMSLINKSLDGWGIYVGIPCKKIKERKKDLLDLEEEFLREDDKRK